MLDRLHAPNIGEGSAPSSATVLKGGLRVMKTELRELKQHLAEVHVAGVCIFYEKDDFPRVLLAKRSPDRELFPGKWECCGGQLQKGESFSEAVVRHFRDEMDIVVQPVEMFHTLYEIVKPDNSIIPGVRFYCLHVSGKAQSKNHSEIVYASRDDVLRMNREDLVPGLRDTILMWLSGVVWRKVSE